MAIFFIFVTNLLCYIQVLCSCINCFQTTKETKTIEFGMNNSLTLSRKGGGGGGAFGARANFEDS